MKGKYKDRTAKGWLAVVNEAGDFVGYVKSKDELAATAERYEVEVDTLSIMSGEEDKQAAAKKGNLFGALMLRLVQSIEVAGAGTSYPNMTKAAKTVAEANPDASAHEAYTLVLTELKIN